MSQSSQREKRSTRKRYALIKLVFGLFPILVVGGFLTPGWVELIATAQVSAETDRDFVVDRIGPYGRRPLLVPRDFSAGFIPELLDLDQLFLGSRLGHMLGDSVARVAAFDRSYGDVIAFDDLGELDTSIVFTDVLMDEPVTEALVAEDTEWALPLCGTLYAGNCVRDDDYAGGVVLTPQPIPEPDTAALVSLGLLGLAWQCRRKHGLQA